MDRIELVRLRNEMAAKRDEVVKVYNDGIAAIDAMLAGRAAPATHAESGGSKQDQPVTAISPSESPRKRKRTPGFRVQDTLGDILEDAAGEWVTAAQLAEEMVRRGYQAVNPVESVRSSANRLTDDNSDRFERDRGRGRYRLRTDQASVELDHPRNGQQASQDVTPSTVEVGMP